MTITKAEIVTPLATGEKFFVVSETAGVFAAVDGVMYDDQADALTALNTAAAIAQATTTYLILRAKVVSGVKATVT